mgnify:CR=1 FL=1
MLKVVVDTNVFISGLIKDDNPRTVINAFIGNKFQLIISEDILGELAYTLAKPRLSGLLAEPDASSLVGLIRKRAYLIRPRQKLTVCRDPKDDKFLEAALEAGADFIVTGDEDLLVLDPFQGIPIITARDFIGRLEK